jgi:hypothetical protein
MCHNLRNTAQLPKVELQPIEGYQGKLYQNKHLIMFGGKQSTAKSKKKKIHGLE